MTLVTILFKKLIHKSLTSVGFFFSTFAEIVKSYFNNTLTIAGLDLVIPYDGGYGPSWGEAKTPFD